MTALERLQLWVEDECTEGHTRVLDALTAAYKLGWQDCEDTYYDDGWEC